MKSKEAAYKRILQYIELTWGIKNITNLDPLARLMIEAATHETMLLENRLDGMDGPVAEKLACRLSPQAANHVRPPHAILHVSPSVPVFNLGKQVNFTLKELPENVKRRQVPSVPFTPVASARIHDIRITHMFFDRSLWAMKGNKRELLGHSMKRAKNNTIWLGLETGQMTGTLEDVPFYFDFPHLLDHHAYYGMMAGTKWSIGGKPLKMESGFPGIREEEKSKSEKEILDFYKDHYLATTGKIDLSGIPKRKIAEELEGITDTETVAPVNPLYWISIEFPANFLHCDLERVFISTNAVPVMNRQLNRQLVLEKDFGNTVSLSSGYGQEFLEIESVSDDAGNTYMEETQPGKSHAYGIVPVRREYAEDTGIINYLERLADIVQNERASFPGLDNDKITAVLEAINSIRENDTKKSELNRLAESAEVALFNIRPAGKASAVLVSYYTTHGGLLNGIPEGTGLMAYKIPELNKSNAMFLTKSEGGRDFFGMEKMKAANNFYLGARDRVLTKYNIISFCRTEWGEYVEKVDVVRKAAISRKPHEGIINVMEIQVTPLREHSIRSVMGVLQSSDERATFAEKKVWSKKIQAGHCVKAKRFPS